MVIVQDSIADLCIYYFLNYHGIIFQCSWETKHWKSLGNGQNFVVVTVLGTVGVQSVVLG